MQPKLTGRAVTKLCPNISVNPKQTIKKFLCWVSVVFKPKVWLFFFVIPPRGSFEISIFNHFITYKVYNIQSSHFLRLCVPVCKISTLNSKWNYLEKLLKYSKVQAHIPNQLCKDLELGPRQQSFFKSPRWHNEASLSVCNIYFPVWPYSPWLGAGTTPILILLLPISSFLGSGLNLMQTNPCGHHLRCLMHIIQTLKSNGTSPLTTSLELTT